MMQSRGRTVAKGEQRDARHIGLELEQVGYVVELRDEKGVRRAAQREHEHQKPEAERWHEQDGLAECAVPMDDVRPELAGAHLAADEPGQRARVDRACKRCRVAGHREMNVMTIIG